MARPAPELTPDEVALLGGRRFVDPRRVAEGASAVVYRAREEGGAEVALKVAKDGASFEGDALRLALLRPRWSAALIAAGAVGGEGRRACLALSWVDGEPLDSAGIRASERGRAALVVAHGVGRALEELHAAGLRHGDVKPANILLRSLEVARDTAEARGATLVDLGLAHALDEGARGGTPAFLAPEVRAGEPVTPAADLFALGLVLDALLAGADDASPRLAAVVRALRLPSPGARPSASWVADEAARALGLAADPHETTARREDRIRRAYLRVRGDLSGAAGVAPEVDGPPRTWLEEVLAAGGARAGTALGPLDPLARSRWLVLACGAQAAAWPALDVSDADLARRLLRAARHRSPEAFALEDLEADDTGSADVVPADDALALVRALAQPRPPARILDHAERVASDADAAPPLVAELAWALVRRGDVGRAEALLAARSDASAELLYAAAEVARRGGDVEQAEALATAIEGRPDAGAFVAAARALRARLAWDRGALDDAEALVAADRGAAAEEIRALVAYARGDHASGLAAVARGALAAEGGVALARLDAVRGMLEHARGDAAASARAFRAATEHATRAGAVVEEATYLTGLAAAAVDAGDAREGIDAATRAALLWERLGRPAQATRALLSRAGAFASVGARHEADAAAAAATAMARACGDVRAEAFARWAVVETRPPGDAQARDEALAAWSRLAPIASRDDVLRGAARLLIWAADDAVTRALDRAHLDAETDAASTSARWEWWGARAREAPERAVLLRLVGLVGTGAPLTSRGPALAAGVELARQLGDVEAARRLEVERAAAAAVLRAGAPVEQRAQVRHVPWAGVGSGDAPSPGLLAAQVDELEGIVRALSTRDRLRPLLEQVLDTLVLWTGVERGLLLLRAPDGGLVPRAARNLGRRDLDGDQLALSMTLARRAMDSREPVVATDAYAQMGDVHASVHALGLRSVLAVPLVARGDVLGVVYLDDRVRKGAFGPSELSWVRLVASHAAQAVADARDQALLRRAVRRAERARAQVAAQLGAREVELEAARAELAQGEGTRFRYDRIVGRSEPMRALLRMVDRVTASDVPVLVVGESGTGKELLARAIHDNGPRKGRAFVSENCGALPEALLETTLFGHVKGAFTGAAGARPGLFDVADGGTLFLDEIGEMPLAMQTKLLRVLQEGEVRPVGGARPRKVDVRILAATHRDLAAMVAEGAFREDLLYRLDVVTIRVPPLRDRTADIPELVTRFVAKHGREGVRVTRAAMDRLVAYPWPGNVRQLENEVRRALVLGGDVIDVAELSPDVARGGPDAAREAGLSLRDRLDALERQLVGEALVKTQGNQTKAAEALGVSRFGLQKMLRRLGVDPKTGGNLTARLDSRARPK